MRINLFGQRNPLGGGVHFSGFCDALKAISCLSPAISEYDYFSEADFSACMKSVGHDDVNIHFINYTYLDSAGCPNNWRKLPGFNIHWAIFETTVLHEEAISWYQDADAVFVPSYWGKDVLINNGINPSQIEVIPEGMDPSQFHPLLRSCYEKNDAFRVLVIGKFEPRKGFPELLEGFCEAFGSENNVKLILKSDSLYLNGQAYTDNLAKLNEQIGSFGFSNYELVTGALSVENIFHLYNYCDVLLFPSRAEGWGLPLLEAIACGMPVITTNYSGHTEFLAPITKLVKTVDHNIVANHPLGVWAVANPSQIADALIELKNNYGKYQTQAMEAAKIMRLEFSWANSAEKCLHFLIKKGVFSPSFSISI